MFLKSWSQVFSTDLPSWSRNKHEQDSFEFYGLLITKKHFSSENLSFRRLYQLQRFPFFYKENRTKKNLFSCWLRNHIVLLTIPPSIIPGGGIKSEFRESLGEVGKHLENARKAVRSTISCRISSSTQSCRFYREFPTGNQILKENLEFLKINVFPIGLRQPEIEPSFLRANKAKRGCQCIGPMQICSSALKLRPSLLLAEWWESWRNLGIFLQRFISFRLQRLVKLIRQAFRIVCFILTLLASFLAQKLVMLHKLVSWNIAKLQQKF